MAENETDGYHPQFVHGSIFSVTGSPIGALYSDKSTAVTRNLGNGHSENDLRPEFRKIAEPMRWFGTTEERVPGYVAGMRERHGGAAEQILVEGAPHVMIFPNLFVAEIQVFVIQPVAVGECIQYSTAVQLSGAPELNRRMVSQSVGSVGPAGMLLADDTEMYERNQRGVAMRPEWLDLRRGLDRERTDERGLTIGTATDETAMRGFWSHYRLLMEALVTRRARPAGPDFELGDRAVPVPRGALRRRARLRRLGSALDRRRAATGCRPAASTDDPCARCR